MLPLPQRLPRLCVHALLCTSSQFLAAFALKCASWSAINQGTSRRAACASLGLQGIPSVDSSNTMASRTLAFELIHSLGGPKIQSTVRAVLTHSFPERVNMVFGIPKFGAKSWDPKNAPLKSSLGFLMSWFVNQKALGISGVIDRKFAFLILMIWILKFIWAHCNPYAFMTGLTPWCRGVRTCLLLLLVTALGGAWLLEQPENSVLEFFPPFQTLLQMMFDACNASAVTSLLLGSFMGHARNQWNQFVEPNLDGLSMVLTLAPRSILL